MLPVAIRTMTFPLNLELQYSLSRMILRRNAQLLLISTIQNPETQLMGAIIAEGLLTERLLHRAMRGMVLTNISKHWRNVYAKE